MLGDRPLTWTRGARSITTDRARIPVDDALALLRDTHWGDGVTRDLLARAMANSLCIGALDAHTLVGFARAVTDLATYAYLTDVVVAPAVRGQGVGAWMMECVLAHPELQGLRRIALLTRDAPEFYERLGFTRGAGNRHYLERLG